MTRERHIRVVHLYDRYLNIYADRGNMDVLRNRMRWRGLSIEIVGFDRNDTLAAGDFDLIYVGGGQDSDQRMIAQRMAGRVGDAIHEAVDGGAALLAVCGGYQLLGRHYRDVSGTMQPGAGLFGAETVAGDTRLIGNVAITATLPAVGAMAEQTVTLAGFENHAGRTTLDAGQRPLGTVIHGHGNDGSGRHEGCITGTAIGTYLHGPLLPRNPELADWLLMTALVHRYGDDCDVLAPLDDRLADDARRVSVARAAAEHA